MTITCRVCSMPFLDPHTFTAREMLQGRRDEFTYSECHFCKSLQIVEEPKDLGKYYEGNYYSHAKESAVKQWLKRQWAKHSAGAFNPLGAIVSRIMGKHQVISDIVGIGVPHNARILDIGCGNGTLLKMLRAIGYTSLTGVDPYRKQVELNGGVNLLTMMPQYVSYDVITMVHTLEHCFDPLATLKEAKDRLHKHGIMLVYIPVANSYAWSVYGTNWVALEAPRHLTIPSAYGLELMCEQLDLKILDYKYVSNEYMFWGSEQYLKNIAMYEPGSYNLLRNLFPSKTFKQQRRMAQYLNNIEQSDSIVAILTHK